MAEWQNWESVPLSERSQLPSASGIYVIADGEQTVWYVGQAIDLKARWMGKGHHRYPQLSRAHRKLGQRIYWQPVPLARLDEQEQIYISQFAPELNGQKVKQYLPKEPQVFREIKRLLKALNKPTQLFPDVRAVVLGEYAAQDETRCLMILVTVNDLYLVDRSARKRHAPKIRNAWTMREYDCGKDDSQYVPCRIPTYRFFAWQFEFISVPELNDHLWHSAELREKILGTIDVFGVEVQALKNFSLIDDSDLPETYAFTRSDGRKMLQNTAYLKFRRPQLRLIEETVKG
jgi:hypothetical protein